MMSVHYYPTFQHFALSGKKKEEVLHQDWANSGMPSYQPSHLQSAQCLFVLLIRECRCVFSLGFKLNSIHMHLEINPSVYVHVCVRVRGILISHSLSWILGHVSAVIISQEVILRMDKAQILTLIQIFFQVDLTQYVCHLTQYQLSPCIYFKHYVRR